MRALGAVTLVALCIIAYKVAKWFSPDAPSSKSSGSRPSMQPKGRRGSSENSGRQLLSGHQPVGQNRGVVGSAMSQARFDRQAYGLSQEQRSGGQNRAAAEPDSSMKPMPGALYARQACGLARGHQSDMSEDSREPRQESFKNAQPQKVGGSLGVDAKSYDVAVMLDDGIKQTAEEHLKFTGDYGVCKIGKKSDVTRLYQKAASFEPMAIISSLRLLKSRMQPLEILNIGKVYTRYTWTKAPGLDREFTADLKKTFRIEGERVTLPEGLTSEKFNELRQCLQKGVISGKGITAEQALEAATLLGGVTIQATLGVRADVLVDARLGKDEGERFTPIHTIFQSGLNLNGYGGGGVPVRGIGTNHLQDKIEETIQVYTLKNARAAVTAARVNQSDILVFNLGIGAGCFAGSYGQEVKQANINALCTAAKELHASGQRMHIIVPNIALSANQTKQLKAARIEIIAADKGAVAVMYADKGLIVSETIAADPMSMLGVHGPGFWWETAGSASDEERIAFLAASYPLGYIRMPVYSEREQVKPKDEQVPKVWIPALSEYMVRAAK